MMAVVVLLCCAGKLQELLVELPHLATLSAHGQCASNGSSLLHDHQRQSLLLYPTNPLCHVLSLGAWSAGMMMDVYICKDKRLILEEALPEAATLAKHTYGNHFIQKLFEKVSMEQRKELANKLQGCLGDGSCHHRSSMPWRPPPTCMTLGSLLRKRQR